MKRIKRFFNARAESHPTLNKREYYSCIWTIILGILTLILIAWAVSYARVVDLPEEENQYPYMEITTSSNKMNLLYNNNI